MYKVESFSLDHTKVRAPFVRRCCVLKGSKGDVVSKFDLRFVQPNKELMDMRAVHTMEHLLAENMRDKMENIIDLSPMGCRTGFYLTVWGEVEPEEVLEALKYGLNKVLEAEDIPAANEVQCGSYKEHSLEGAKELARKVLDGGISTKFMME
ncbi:S-ribosylhomocysteine lyase [uncultured Clostridium sp.]|uniref:S-ribosylhomocysteine lyase n=1 Tax=uncultured Clostridium sp. TaxID=59620 RepID=UPI0025D23ECF|nr:S-ribosylhomocysteine lyase [uncultured Clostridium sp.]